MTNVNVSNTTFNNDTLKGIYAETLDHATFDNITVNNSGTVAGSPNGVNLNLKYGNYSVSPSRTRTSTATPPATRQRCPGDRWAKRCPEHTPLSPASISNVTLTNNTFTGSSPIDASFGDNITGITLTGNTLGGNSLGLLFFALPSQSLSLGDTSFASSLAGDAVINATTSGVDGTARPTAASRRPRAEQPAQEYAIVDKIVDGVDAPGVALVRTKGNNVYLTTNSFYNNVHRTLHDDQRRPAAGDQRRQPRRYDSRRRRRLYGQRQRQ